MSKAVLVMDMPEKCEECKSTDPYENWCPFHGYISMEEYSIKKPDDCPLKPMLEKKPEYLSINSEKGYCDGWNACIDEICGEEREDDN